MQKGLYFVSGIDTDVGKSYATGYFASLLNKEGLKTITQKFIQTGNADISEDIILHRKIMGIKLQEVDYQKLTMPEIFSYPCSPHLASKIDDRPIDYDKIKDAAKSLLQKYDIVLQEGAGGLMVPLSENYLTIDYVKNNHLPLVFVTSGKLGSINHTLLSFEAIKARNIKVAAIIYNTYCVHYDKMIVDDTYRYIKNICDKLFSEARFVTLPKIIL